jgi:hypothetical protein
MLLERRGRRCAARLRISFTTCENGLVTRYYALRVALVGQSCLPASWQAAMKRIRVSHSIFALARAAAASMSAVGPAAATTTAVVVGTGGTTVALRAALAMAALGGPAFAMELVTSAGVLPMGRLEMVSRDGPHVSASAPCIVAVIMNPVSADPDHTEDGRRRDGFHDDRRRRLLDDDDLRRWRRRVSVDDLIRRRTRLLDDNMLRRRRRRRINGGPALYNDFGRLMDFVVVFMATDGQTGDGGQGQAQAD